MKTKIINVFVVEDSKVARELLIHIIEKDPQLKVVGWAENGEDALKWLETGTCDVVTMDIKMPGLNGFEVTKKIMETRPLPTVIISAGYTPNDSSLAFKALEVGALAILEKPHAPTDINYPKQCKEIIDTIKMIADMKVIAHHKAQSFISMPLKLASKVEIKAVGIGASLGGPLAIAKILENLPANLPVPIFIVQHISEGFTEDFIRWLQERSKLRIFSAKNGTIAQAGCVYVAVESCHMEIKHGGCITLDYSQSLGIRPSVGRLFRSLAETYGPHCIGIILTGMGGDGAEEMLLMKQKGAYTIAQDQESCLMFGMPKEAIQLGAAQKILPLDRIAQALIDLTSRTHLQKGPNGK